MCEVVKKMSVSVPVRNFTVVKHMWHICWAEQYQAAASTLATTSDMQDIIHHSGCCLGY